MPLTVIGFCPRVRISQKSHYLDHPQFNLGLIRPNKGVIQDDAGSKACVGGVCFILGGTPQVCFLLAVGDN